MFNPSIVIQCSPLYYKILNFYSIFVCPKCIYPFEPFYVVADLFCCNTIKSEYPSFKIEMYSVYISSLCLSLLILLCAILISIANSL